MWRNCMMAVMLPLLVACGGDESVAAPAAGKWADLHAPVEVVDWPLPSLRPGTHSPALTATHDGRLLLSWVNSQRGRRHVFQFSSYDLARQQWRGAPFTIVIGHSLFIDSIEPHNTPQMGTSRDGTLWAQWLQSTGRRGAGEVMFSRSRDGGANWAEPQRPHPGDEGILQEGHVSLWPQGDQGMGMAWLDVRKIDNVHMVSLRVTDMDAAGRVGSETLLASWAMGCTASAGVALTARGPLLAWRGGTDGDGHDLHVTRRDHQGWGAPMRVAAAADRLPSCFASAPVIATHGEAVVAAWLEKGKRPETIRVALSTDAGDTFALPVAIAQNTDVAVYPFAVALDARQAWVLWTHVDDAGVQSLWLSRRSLDLQEEYERREIVRASNFRTEIDCSKIVPCNTGMPRFVLHQHVGYLVWTEVLAEGEFTLRGVKILPAQGRSSQ